jgi:two-component system, chemotaxis family, sensor kinase CheA
MDPMAAIKQTFFQECEEQLGELENGLLAIQDGDADPETVNAVFRAVHSIKGGAGAFHLDELVHFAHAFESVLDHLRAGRLTAAGDLVKTMLRAADMLADLVRAARDDTGTDAPRRAALASELRALDPDSAGKDHNSGHGEISGDDPDGAVFQPVAICFDDFEIESAPAGHHFVIRFTPKPDLYAKANETALLMRELGNLGETIVTCDFSSLPALDELDPEGSYLTWTIELRTVQDETAVRAVFEFVEWDCELDVQLSEVVSVPNDGAFDATIQTIQSSNEAETASNSATQTSTAVPAPEAEPLAGNEGGAEATPNVAKPGKLESPRAAQATIRVDLDRVDRLINFVGELVITQAMLSQRVLEAGLARTSDVASGLDELEQLIREIKDSVMAIRAQPVKSVFQRIPRLVREVAAMTGKSVRLVTDGESTEVDKTVIEHLADPLTHMIRNAIDHGLESPEVRKATGKPEEGVVRLSAMHRSGRIVIEVADDGAGINRARVKSLAVDKGLIAADAPLSDEEIDNLIFLPGFSTASAVSDISGRGVGMDVVRRSIQALGGRISIHSRPGQGSTFLMSLPLTLAVLDGMVVTVAGETLVVPLTAIIETLQPKPGAVHRLGGNAKVIAIRDQFIPVIDVGCELDYRSEFADPNTSLALLVESGNRVRGALLVDAVLGQRQVVIKSLEANYRHVQGVAGATILGDGRLPLFSMSMRSCPIRGKMPAVPNSFLQQQAKRMTEIIRTELNSASDLARTRELIAFRVGDQEFCVNIMLVREFRGWTKATAMPKSPSFVCGIVNLRGTVLPLVDLAARLGFPPAEPTARHVIIVAQIGAQTGGLLVDEVSDILTVTNESIQPTPDVASDMAKTFVRGVIAVDQRMICLIALDQVLPACRQDAA